MGDVITIILDLDKMILGFAKNNDKHVMANGANLKSKSFNLFVTMYGPNSSVSVVKSIDNGDQKEDDEPIGICEKCNKSIFSTDFNLNNIFLNEDNNKWIHNNCNLKQDLPQLNLQDVDQFHPFLSHPNLQIYDKYTATGGASNYINSFGIISVNQGFKKWDIKISGQQVIHILVLYKQKHK